MNFSIIKISFFKLAGSFFSDTKFLSSVILFLFFTYPTSVQAQQKNLDYFLNQAIQRSPLIKEINNNILINRIDSLRLLAEYKPRINGVSDNFYAPVVDGYGYDNIITNVRNFTEQISASKTFVGKRNLKIRFDGIQLLNDSLSIVGKITEQDLRRTVIAAYIATYGSWREYKFNNEVYNLLSTEDTILKKLTQSSVYRQTDYLTFFVTLKQQHLIIIQSKQQYQNDYATLNYLCGLVDTSFIAIDSPRITLRQLPQYSNSIFFQKFTTDSLLLNNASQQIDLAYKPKLSFTADGGYVSSLSYLPYKNFGAGVALNFVVPIYDGNQKKILHQRLNILEQTRTSNRDFYTAQYQQQIAQLAQLLQSTNQIIDETSDQLKYTRTLIDANRKLLVTGDVRISDYIIAISNYLNAENTITQNIVRQFQLITQINYWNR